MTCISKNLQVASIKLHVTDFLHHNLLHLMAVLLLLVPTLLHGFVDTFLPCLHRADRLESLLLALVADLPGLLLAVLGVAVLLSFLGTSLHLQLADLLGLKMAVLLLDREGEDVGELLAISMNISLAHFHLDLSWDIIAILRGFPCTDDTLGTIPIVLGALVPFAVELHGVSTGHIVDNLLLHKTIRGLNIGALVIVFCGHVNFVRSITDSILASEAPLDLIRFFQGLVVNSLDKITHQLVHIEANTFDVCLDDSGAVLVHGRLAFFLVLCPAGLLGVWLALVLEDDFLNHVTVGILVHPIPTYISLTNIRMVLLGRGWCWILLWW